MARLYSLKFTGTARQFAAADCGKPRPVSRKVFGFDSTFGQPPEMPASMSGSPASSLCVTVKRTSASPYGSMSKVTRECLLLSSVSFGRA